MSTEKHHPDEPKRDLHYYAERLGVPVEQIRTDLGLPPDDDIRRNSIGCAALDDIIEHATPLLSAMDSRILRAIHDDHLAVKDTQADATEPFVQNESFWRRERHVIERIVYRARFARGHQTS